VNGQHRARRSRRWSVPTRALADNGGSVVVAVLAGTFGGVVVAAVELAGRILDAGARTGQSGTVAVLLPLAAWVFFGVALSVASVVTVNTCGTAMAGRTRVLALERLLGGSASLLRRRLTRDGAVVGIIGALAGVLLALALANVGVVVAGSTGIVEDSSPLVPLQSLVVWVTVAGAVVIAFRIGSRRVLSLAPLQALGSTVESEVSARTNPWRTAVAVVLFLGGWIGVAGSIVLGATSYLAVLLAVAAGAVSFAGLVLGSPVVLPPVLRLVAAVGRFPMAMLAGRNALRSPARASRAAVGLLIAVTLVVTFSVGLATYEAMLVRQVDGDPVYYRGIHDQFVALSTMFTVLIGGAGVIAAAGVVNVSSMTVAQRRQEFGLLRTLGATRRQVAVMVTVETVVMVTVALVLGVLLGVGYGWAGAYSILGTTQGAALIAPVFPLSAVAVVVIGTLAVALWSVLGPVRRAMRVPPTEALAVD